ncbi:MAG: hypothetical protein R3F34_05405 [Planctomycetota bacterium]
MRRAFDEVRREGVVERVLEAVRRLHARRRDALDEVVARPIRLDLLRALLPLAAALALAECLARLLVVRLERDDELEELRRRGVQLALVRATRQHERLLEQLGVDRADAFVERVGSHGLRRRVLLAAGRSGSGGCGGEDRDEDGDGERHGVGRATRRDRRGASGD